MTTRPGNGVALDTAHSQILVMGVPVTIPFDHGHEHTAAQPADHSQGRAVAHF